MCGIAGYFGKNTLQEASICLALEKMKRRGPNGQQVERILVNAAKNLYLLHSRLSIIDLDVRSSQPFHYKNKTLVFNGEIYNYLEVREELKKLSHVFETESDTEVLIHALEEWGQAALNKIEGMFAFAYFDATTKNLMLARDPFGEKPLYYYQPSNGEIYFGSEIKFISSLGNIKFTPNTNHICRFLVNGYKSLYKNSEEFFTEIKALPAGYVLEINEHGAEKMFAYWQPKASTKEDMSFEEAAAGTRERLINSVKMRLRSDIPIAFCMSGGVDSNSLIGIAKRVFNYDVHGFTIQNSDARYEEQDMIDIGVRELGIQHSIYPIESNNFLEDMRELVRYHDAPVITISFFLNWFLQKQISKHGYHISISGTAADELFSGYFDHQLLYLYDIQKDTELLAKSIQNWQRDIAPIVRNPLLQSPENFINDPFQRDHAYLGHEKYTSYLCYPWHEFFEERFYRKGLLQNRMMNEIFHETTPISLHEDDLNAMYFSIENRAPFLDRELFNFAHSIPVKYLVRDGTAKAVLRESMRGIVPDPILNSKRKVGFNAPITDLLKVEDKKVREYLLKDSFIFDIVRKESIDELIRTSYHPNSDSKYLFAFVSCKIFLEEFC